MKDTYERVAWSILAAGAIKRTVKLAAKQASRHGNLQARIEALERLLGVAE